MRPIFADMRREVREGTLIGAAIASSMAIPLIIALSRFGNGSLGVEDFSAIALAYGTAAAPLVFLTNLTGELRRAASFLPEAFAVMDLPQSDPRLKDGQVSPSAPAKGIRFESVRFAYPGTGRFVLDGVDLFIPAGSSMALVGENGAGKSTLIKLLCRFYDPTEGRITLDGTDLRDFNIDELRNHFAVVFQDFTHFPLTAAENIDVGCVEGMPDPALRQRVVLEAGLAEVLDRLPEGSETPLAREFGGVDLSGGEWQRFALARALASRHGRRASVLVLDEPTAALDVRMEHDLFNRFSSLTSGLTTLLVSHRFSTVQMAKQIAVLENGRIVEEGTHEELVAAQGLYARLYDLQARRFRDEGALK